MSGGATFVLGSGVVAVSLYFWKKHIDGGVCKSPARLDGKVVMVTGSNTGIGQEAARDFAKRGARVYLACRSLERAQAAADVIIRTTQVPPPNVQLIKLDLASLQSVKQCVDEFKHKERRLDILVNNAGLMLPSSDNSRTQDGFDSTIGINHFGPFLLTLLLVDLLMSSAPSRVVNLSSRAHVRGAINWSTVEHRNSPNVYSGYYAYCQSKMANLLFSQELARRLEGTGVTVYALHPGIISTSLWRAYLPVSTYNIVDRLSRLLLWPVLKGPVAGAQTTIHCAVDDKAGEETGLYYSDCKPKACKQLPNMREEASKLWDVSLKMVGLESKDINPRLA